jgi:PKHD-type hydroxylase
MILVVKRVLSGDELTALRGQLATARFADGRESASGAAREQKQVQQLDRAGDSQREFGEVIAKALLRHPLVQAAALPKSIRHPNINRYEQGMYYGPHLDTPLMRGNVTTRVDISATVFLSEPGEYEGGELSITSDGAPVSIKAAAGDAVLYPSGSIHEVKPVTKGARLVAVTWLQSLIRDPAQRKILWELGDTIKALEAQGASAETLLGLQATHHNLMRMWLEA